MPLGQWGSGSEDTAWEVVGSNLRVSTWALLPTAALVILLPSPIGLLRPQPLSLRPLPFHSQYIKACKTGNMDQALSLWFLLGWIGGDSCNLIGSFLADQLPLQVGGARAQ